MNPKICVVVVTYNRLNLLQECIDAIRSQTRKLDEIIVVNNNSSDGTKEWLDTQTDITIIHQNNIGGAGGFHNGMKLAYQKCHDWLWLMDDDCLPQNTALEILSTTMNDKNIVYNSLILSKNDPDKINFGFYDYKKEKYYDEIAELSKEKEIFGAGFFNGTLISSKTIKKVGFPIIEFFIYGDEYEYYSRILSNGIEIQTLKKSIVYHPIQKFKYLLKGKNKYRFNYFSELGAKYTARNLMTIWYLSDKFRLRRLLKTYLLDIFGILFIQKETTIFLNYLISILRGPKFILKHRSIKKYYNN